MYSKFMNSEKSKTSDPNRILLNLTDNIDFRRKDNFFALSFFFIILNVS